MGTGDWRALNLANRHACTLALSRKRLTSLPNHRLETVYCHLFDAIPSQAQMHRALDDARLTAEIWLEMERMGGYGFFISFPEKAIWALHQEPFRGIFPCCMKSSISS